jgi:dynein assembly factor 1, axonemal
VNCKSIWLDSNGLEVIEGLEALVELRCLFLSKNLISKMEGFQSLVNLTILDLSYNRLTKIENISCCGNLQSLNLSRNALSNRSSIEHLRECVSLNTLDLTHNQIESEEVLSVFPEIPTLATLSINGNEVTKIQSFRKRMIYSLPKLGYLDRPIEELEKLAAEAFMTGGTEAELAAREAYKLRKFEEKKKEQADFREWQRKHREERIAMVKAGHQFITKLTPEEEAHRAEQAHQDALKERAWANKMLYGGVGDFRLDEGDIEETSPITEIPSVCGGGGGAAALVMVDDSDACASETVVETVTTGLSDTDIDIDTALVEEIFLPPAVPSDEELAEAAQLEDKKAKIAAEEAAEKLRVAEELRREREEEQERARLVAESMKMYKEQVASGDVGGGVSLNRYKKTWDAGFTEPTRPDSVDSVAMTKPVYFTEKMDFELAKLVRECKFDFDAVASRLQSAVLSGEFGMLNQLSANRITTDQCRARWSQLDAEQWSEGNTPALDVLHKICINPAVLDKDGIQPSFDALRTMANGLQPSYLKVPTSFPSTADIGGEAEEDEDETDDSTPVLPMQIPSLAEAVSMFQTLD